VSCGLGNPRTTGPRQMRHELQQWLRWSRPNSQDPQEGYPGWPRHLAEQYQRQILGYLNLHTSVELTQMSLTTRRLRFTALIPMDTGVPRWNEITRRASSSRAADSAVRIATQMAAYAIYTNPLINLEECELPSPVRISVRTKP